MVRAGSLRAFRRPRGDPPVRRAPPHRIQPPPQGNPQLPSSRQLHGGPPEYGHVDGVETTTGPLGQGVANSVGMAIAETHLARCSIARTTRSSITGRTSSAADGDLMEGVSYEAASLAGHLGLGKLLWLYDDNRITIDGTSISPSPRMSGALRGAGVARSVRRGRKRRGGARCGIEAAGSVEDRPSLIVVRSHIGYGSPNKQDTAAAHGAPLGEEEIRLTKEVYGWPPAPPFLVPDAVRNHMGRQVVRGETLAAEWSERFERYRAAYPELATELERRIRSDLPLAWDEDLPRFAAGDDPIATRAASGRILTALAPRLPELIGGSADLSGSNNTLIDSPNFSRHEPEAATCGGASASTRWVRSRTDSFSTRGPAVHRDVLHVHGLRPAVDAARGPDGTAEYLRDDARLDRPRRRWPDAPADRAPRLLPGPCPGSSCCGPPTRRRPCTRGAWPSSAARGPRF